VTTVRASTGTALAAALCLLAAASPARAQDPYEVEIPESVRRWWSIGGHLEARPVLFDLDPESAAYRLRYFADSPVVPPPPSPLTTADPRLSRSGTAGGRAAGRRCRPREPDESVEP